MLCAVFWAFVAYDREDIMIAALASIVLAGIMVSLGAWILLARDRRRGAAGRGRPPETGGPADWS